MLLWAIGGAWSPRHPVTVKIARFKSGMARLCPCSSAELERLSSEQDVTGSNPVKDTLCPRSSADFRAAAYEAVCRRFKSCRGYFWGCSLTRAKHWPVKPEDTGSNPANLAVYEMGWHVPWGRLMPATSVWWVQFPSSPLFYDKWVISVMGLHVSLAMRKMGSIPDVSTNS